MGSDIAQYFSVAVLETMARMVSVRHELVQDQPRSELELARRIGMKTRAIQAPEIGSSFHLYTGNSYLAYGSPPGV